MNRLTVVLVCVSASSACQHVTPYQRERLAHHSMTDPEYASPAEQHVRTVQEGASGGQADAVSGCGCN